MDYPSPQALDFNEVHELNKAFLSLLAVPGDAKRLLADSPPEVADRLAALRTAERRRLATTPFLLFSLRERDEAFWDRVYEPGAVRDLFSPAAAESEGRSRLVAAALGFLWQMARQNPYTLRLVCCASVYWCERLGEQPLMQVISRLAMLDDVLRLRAGESAAVWQRLLEGGMHANDEVRRATHYSILQTLLIRPQPPKAFAWRSAACRTRLPSLRLSDED